MIKKYGYYLFIRVISWLLFYLILVIVWHTNFDQSPMPTGHYGVALISSSVADSIHNIPLVSWGAHFYTPDASPLHQGAVDLGWFSPFMTLNILNLGICVLLVISSNRLEKKPGYRHPWLK